MNYYLTRLPTVATDKVTQLSANDKKLEENAAPAAAAVVAAATAAVKSTRYSFRSATCAPD